MGLQEGRFFIKDGSTSWSAIACISESIGDGFTLEQRFAGRKLTSQDNLGSELVTDASMTNKEHASSGEETDQGESVMTRDNDGGAGVEAR
jgi:hypothetical protein